MIVQVRREVQQGKGARLSTRINPQHGGFDLDQLVAEAARYEPPQQLDPPPSFAHALALRLSAEPEQVLTDDVAIVPELRAALPKTEIAHRPAADWPVDLDAEFAFCLPSHDNARPWKQARCRGQHRHGFPPCSCHRSCCAWQRMPGW